MVDLVAVEPEPYLRARAEEAAAAAPIPVTVVDAVAERLPFADATFDVAVTARVLCSVEDLAASLRELHRVLRPGGELRFYEHGASSEPRLARWQRDARPRLATDRRRLPRQPRHRPRDPRPTPGSR